MGFPVSSEKVAFVSGPPNLHLRGRLDRQQVSKRQGEPFTASMPALRRGGAVKPRSPEGAPKAQGLTAPPRRKIIVDAANREARYAVASACPLPASITQLFLFTLSLPIPSKTRCAEHAVTSGQASCALQPSARPLATRTSDLVGGCCFQAFILHDGALSWFHCERTEGSPPNRALRDARATTLYSVGSVGPRP
jgi:hypothetical protein